MEPSNEDVARVYQTVLSCFRHPSGHPGRDAYTERSLFQFHQELEKRGLSKDPTDDTHPDPFAGYSDIQISGKRLRAILPDEGMVAILDFAYQVRTNKANSIRLAMSCDRSSRMSKTRQYWVVALWKASSDFMRKQGDPRIGWCALLLLDLP